MFHATHTRPLAPLAAAVLVALAPHSALAQVPVTGAERRTDTRERSEGLSFGERVARHNARNLATLTSALQRDRGITPIGEHNTPARPRAQDANAARSATRFDLLGNRFVRGVLTDPSLGVRRPFIRRQLSASVHGVGPAPRPAIARQPGFFAAAGATGGVFGDHDFLPGSAVASPLADRRRILRSDGLLRFQREGVPTAAPRVGELQGRQIRGGLSSVRHRFTVGTRRTRAHGVGGSGANITTGSAVRSRTSPDRR